VEARLLGSHCAIAPLRLCSIGPLLHLASVCLRGSFWGWGKIRLLCVVFGPKWPSSKWGRTAERGANSSDS